MPHNGEPMPYEAFHPDDDQADDGNFILQLAPEDDANEELEQLRRHSALLARELATLVYDLGVLASRSLRLHTMAEHIRHQLEDRP